MSHKKNLHWQILLALILAFIAGFFTSKETSIIYGIKIYDIYEFIGTLFLNGLRMLSIPLILTSIISGMANIGTQKNISKMGGRTLLYYFSTTSIAILVGLILINIVHPGTDPSLIAEHDAVTRAKLEALFNNAQSSNSNIHHFFNIFYQLLPNNIFQAAANGQLLGLIVFSLLFGYFILHLKEEQKTLLTEFWSASFGAIMMFTMWFLKFTPIGVFGLVAKAITETGFHAFWPLMKFFITVLAALGIHAFIVLSLFLVYFGKINPLKHIKAMLPVLLTAFSTSSSAATLPMAIEAVEKNAGVSNKVSSFVLPLGITVNMNGTALYEGMAAIFIAQTYGIAAGFDTQLMVLILALITSIGVSGIPSSSLVAITIILGAIGLPLEAIGLIMVTDRILDMCRTAVNVYGDTCGAVIIAKFMGERVFVE